MKRYHFVLDVPAIGDPGAEIVTQLRFLGFALTHRQPGELTLQRGTKWSRYVSTDIRQHLTHLTLSYTVTDGMCSLRAEYELPGYGRVFTEGDLTKLMDEMELMRYAISSHRIKALGPRGAKVGQCPFCQGPLYEEDRFCSSCGQAVTPPLTGQTEGPKQLEP